MINDKGKKVALLFLSGTLLLGFLSGAHTTDLTAVEGGDYIEVHGPSIACVPLTAKYVKYDGIVRKIAMFAEALSPGDEDCQCPKCCEGHCYVVIYIGFVSPSGPVRMLAILWLEC
jgi:hypothetical protein